MRTRLICIKSLSLILLLLCSTAANGQTQNPKPQFSGADEINKQLPGWLKIGGEYRLRYEGRFNSGGKKENDDNYFLSRFRLDLTIKPIKHLTFFIQAQDSQALGFNSKPSPAIHENNFDLRQAYIEWRQSDQKGLAVRAGRQELNFGDQRLVGSLNWTNTARTFDAVKVSYAVPKYSFDVFASSVVAIQDGVFDRHRDGNNFYGAYFAAPKLTPKAKLGAYAYWKTEPFVRGENGRTGDADTVTVGASLSYKLASNLDSELEAALQRGSFASDSIEAHAVHARLIYSISKKESVPKLLLEYNHASGDGNPSDGVRGTFDQLFPTGHAKYGVIDLVGLRNQHDLRIGSIWQARKRLKIEIDYHSFWLARKRDGLYNAGGALIARSINGTSGRHIAQEADLQVNYNMGSGITLGGGYAYWAPGTFWKKTTPGEPPSFVYTFINYKF